jgi:hypothetical protein
MDGGKALEARSNPGSLVFACAVDSPESAQDALLLTQSIGTLQVAFLETRYGSSTPAMRYRAGPRAV